MKPEPLIGKEHFGVLMELEVSPKEEFEKYAWFHKSEVESAIDWLKGKIEDDARCTVRGFEDNRYPVDFDTIMRLLDEAFTDCMDVVKEKKVV